MQKQIPLTITSVLVISLLLSVSFLINPASAQAIAIVSGFNYGIKGISYQASTDTFWILSNNATASKVYLYQMDRESGSLIFSFNHTQNWIANSFAVPQDIWCGQTDCFITTASSTTGQVVKISTEDVAPNIFKGENITGSFANPIAAGFYQITGVDVVSGGFGSITLWIDTCSTSVATNCNGIVRIVDGISMLSAATLPGYSGTTNAHKLKMAWSGISGATDNYLAGGVGTNADTAGNNRIVLYNLASQTIACQTASPSLNSLLGTDVNFDGGAGGANHKIYTGSINGILYVWNESCTLVQTITTGLSGDLRYVQYESGFLFVQETGSNAWIMQFATNSTGHVLTTTTSTYQTFPSTAQSAFIGAGAVPVADMILFAGFGTLYFPYTGDTAGDKKIGILQYGEGDDDDTGTGINCDLPENENILICRLGGDGTLGSAGAFVIGNITEGTGILGIGCSIGLVDCTTDDNPQTNGLGLLIFIASIFVIVGMFYKSMGASATFQMPVFIWVVIIVSLSAFFTITGLIDPIFLILSIVAVIALAVPKVIGVIQNRSFGGGGSTE